MFLKPRTPNFLALGIKQPNRGWLRWARHLDVPHHTGDDSLSGVNVIDHEIVAT
jgi:hypothetical protein